MSALVRLGFGPGFGTAWLGVAAFCLACFGGDITGTETRTWACTLARSRLDLSSPNSPNSPSSPNHHQPQQLHHDIIASMQCFHLRAYVMNKVPAWSKQRLQAFLIHASLLRLPGLLAQRFRLRIEAGGFGSSLVQILQKGL